MSFMNKLKNFFYDEEEIEEEVEEKPKKEVKEPKKTKKVNIYDIEKEKSRVNIKTNKIEDKKELPERELFKSERTFNFPMDIDDDEDFEPAVSKSIKHIENEDTNNVNTVSRVTRSNYSQSKSQKDYSSLSYEPLIHKKEEKKFKPTPIISPVYGILDKDYTNDESKAMSETKEFNFNKKIDFDTVRKKAYGDIEEKKDIFYNLDEEKEEINIKEEDNIEDEYKEEPYKKDEVIITYEQVPEEQEETKEEEEKEIEIPKLTRSRKTKKKIEEEVDDEETDRRILDDTNEHDLFNLIDNMYSDEEDEEEDEE